MQPTPTLPPVQGDCVGFYMTSRGGHWSRVNIVNMIHKTTTQQQLNPKDRFKPQPYNNLFPPHVGAQKKTPKEYQPIPKKTTQDEQLFAGAAPLALRVGFRALDAFGRKTEEEAEEAGVSE